MYLKEMVRKGVGWINLAQNRDEKWSVMNTVTVSLSRKNLFHVVR